jgi:predicted component of type VI protein secretion system
LLQDALAALALDGDISAALSLAAACESAAAQEAQDRRLALKLARGEDICTDEEESNLRKVSRKLIVLA